MIVHGIVFALFLSAPGPAPDVREPSPVVLHVLVNGADLGDFFLQLAPAGDVLVSEEDLLKLGLRLPAAREVSDSTVSLASLAPWLRFELDESSAVLRITASAEVLPTHEIDLSWHETTPAESPRNTTGFLNYNLSYRTLDSFRHGGWSCPLEAAARWKDWLGVSTFSVTSTERGAVRLNSILTWDAAGHSTRVIIGDSPGRSSRLGGAQVLGGIRVTSEFETGTFADPTAHQGLEGVIETPSDIEIYANNVLLHREHLAAGTFRYTGLPLAAGSGNLSLLIRDAFGRERTLEIPYYQSSSLLRPGLDEYSYSVGFKRRGFGVRSFAYDDLALLAGHRRGLSSTLTVGMGVEADHDTYQLIPSAAWTIGSLGEVQAEGAVSRDAGKDGARGRINCASGGRRQSVHLSLEGSSRDHAGVSMWADASHSRWSATVGATVWNDATGSISMQFDRAETYERGSVARMSMSCGRGLGRSVWLTVRMQRSRLARRDATEGFAVINLGLGPLRTGTINLDQAGEVRRATLDVRQDLLRGTGLAYQFRTSTIDDSRIGHAGDAMVSTSYHAEHFRSSVAFRNRPHADEWELSVAGSLAAIHHSLFLARPITDGFALVRVGGVKGVPVLLSRQPDGATGRGGRLFVPDLSSNVVNRISLDHRDLPINCSLERPERSLILPSRGGAIVDFEPNRLQSFEGRAFFMVDGAARPAEMAGFEISLHGRVVQSVVGKDGQFYFENLPAGTYPARLFLDGQECRFTIHIPRSDAMTVDLGDIRCEAEK